MTQNKFFKSTCSKCKKYGDFDVLNARTNNASKCAEYFHFGNWRKYSHELFTITSACKNCNCYVSGSVAVIWDEVKNRTPALSDFTSSIGEITQNENLFIELDVPPLIPQQHYSNPLKTDINYLYEQAERCYAIGAWDAVVILCRKIIDIQSLSMWSEVFEAKPESNLHERIRKLLAQGQKFDNDIPIEDQIDINNENHIILSDMEQVRLLGNFSAHSEICILSDDAEGALIYTESFIKRYQKWSNSLANSKAHK